MFKRLFAHLPRGQLLRYLIVGAWNTLFGYACYFLVVRFLLHILSISPSLVASIAVAVAAVINVTVSFLGYKWFVFRTRGRYWQEYVRSMMVYLPGLATNAVLVAPLTAMLRLIRPIREQAPYVAGALLTGVTFIASFFGHKHISFKRPSDVERTSIDSRST